MNDIAAEFKELRESIQKQQNVAVKLEEQVQSEPLAKKKRKLILGERKLAPGNYINFILLAPKPNKTYRRARLVSYKAEDFPLSPDDIADALRSSFVPRTELQPRDQKDADNMEKLLVLINDKKWEDKKLRPYAIDNWTLMDEDPSPTFSLQGNRITSFTATESDSEKEEELPPTQELVDE